MQSITITEILKRKHFEKAEVVAGTSGLHKNVKWVHVVEVIAIKKLLNGHELILTTGLGWKENKALFKSFLTQLIESNATGLCIEVSSHTSFIPQDIIDLANEHQFPIILFHEEVPFVQITQDIHSLLINHQYRLISDLENYSQNLNKKLLEVNNHKEILVFFQTFLNVQVVAFFDEETILLPELPTKERWNLIEKIKNNQQSSFKYMASQSVQVLENHFAELVILTEDREINEFDLLILDRTTTALAQHFLRDLYVEEKRRLEETEWMIDWLDGLHNNVEIKEHLSYLEPGLKLNGGVVCACKWQSTDHSTATTLDKTYFKLLFRTIFEQQGFYVFSIEVKHHIIFILGNQRPLKSWKQRVEEAFKRFEKVDYNQKLKAANISFGIGKFVKQLNEIHSSYKSAKETLLFQKMLTKDGQSYFYEDLHMYRIMSLLNKHSDLQEIVLEYLQPVIDYDNKFNGKLVETLKTYLACNGSKQETAKKLFVVRQTMYHRIEKLETLLGKDFMSSEKRLAIEFMLLAYEYLNTTERYTKALPDL
ncbi:PucR family transcriptional regulator [Halalkalibacter akibai]|uniref:Putative regulatory protein n=1 Tax=Halalkalibacter akibai (strain ATCC 43226 / DSM 21942 / CIP 109018 / JCM 9157 / 1139) TaxID=1236973 RepID=W4QTJ1_HALA3|nr:PucR family transcriptional regulator ligand-binding domain-containing protein [Halalkalibacter akibai]GAE35242.1 putative regulatory protein [Halalkalibacter akibai JCM 9157]